MGQHPACHLFVVIQENVSLWPLQPVEQATWHLDYWAVPKPSIGLCHWLDIFFNCLGLFAAVVKWLLHVAPLAMVISGEDLSTPESHTMRGPVFDARDEAVYQPDNSRGFWKRKSHI